MSSRIKRLSLAVALLVGASLILLISDWNQRKSPEGKIARLAVFQFSSRPTLDDGMEGVFRGLEETGLREGENIAVKRYNAEGDMQTANAVAREITDGRYDMVVTLSTPSLQTVANANKQGKAVHVFGIVTDPAGSGVGISRTDPLKHPSHMAGIGTFQPVEEVFRLAKEIHPQLKTVGVVWCPAETCSVACLEKGRRICKELGIELLEAPVDSTTGVREATESLLSRNVEAIWIGGDNIVELAAATLIGVATRRGIPVFTNNPDQIKDGALFTLGANYREVGRLSGRMAGEILKGAKPASYRIENVVPPQLHINKGVLKKIKQSWSFPAAVQAKADAQAKIDEAESVSEEKRVINQASAGERISDKQRRPAQSPLQKKWRITLVKYVESPSTEEGERGIMKGLVAAGLKEGRDFEIKTRSAQGDMMLLNTVIDAAAADKPDLVLLFSSPTLQKAVTKLSAFPIVFTYVADPIAAGAGKTLKDHLPNITGAFTRCDYDGMIRLTKELFPQAKKVGTLFTPSEVNSVYHHDQLKKTAQARGLRFDSVGVNSTNEVMDGTLALCTRGIDVITQILDNLNDACFASIVNAAKSRRMPLLGFATLHAQNGAIAAVARDFEQGGYVAGELAARIMRGESPAAIPFTPVDKSDLIINLEAARALGVEVPPGVLKRAKKIIGK